MIAIDHVILGFLAMGEMTGYDIKRLMGISTSFFYDASYGSIYPTLKKLEGRGLVRSGEAGGRGRLRKVYSLTEEGRRELLRWLEGPPGRNRFRYDFLTRMFFFAHLPEEKVVAAVEGHLTEIRAVSERLRAIGPVAAARADRYQAWTLRFGLDFFAFLQGWFGRFLLEVKGGAPPEQGKREGDRV